ncbi:NAD(P)-binding domain-containing protein [Arthrobacter sp. zg-Y820]|uniref:NAD(P)-binding domain-containing protein n=1 Tax=unclassified Arthrobacter TaxID=235627 RepID=UPI001E4BBB8A|nr:MULTISPECIES: NAD(P)-binding domain-containing protein [unclassified Arthrobacter]MCC9195503.1 NAD(P)/FAD-dependent oxidoreductase [Arthrobacter sp. zg-Y820]MDK1278362.1 NAD(P)-binding domain-containing protein [Arthrobacter sp. zg.Y820]WIB10238.1 NAD(P)-binding domain-containing protein [Arthrobacter sp. zg-Y820]
MGQDQADGVEVEVAVIGAGQAGLSAAYYLQRRGLAAGSGFVVLDANEGPGGAWRHRWDSLTLGSVHGIHDLPRSPLGTPNPREPASSVVTRYYGDYETEFGLHVQRPVRVHRVSPAGKGRLRLDTSGGSWRARAVINATGTWDKPHWPSYPGRENFGGTQLHTHDFSSAADFAGRRVLVVGGGTSAVQFLLQLHDAGARTIWSTRRPPDFTGTPFDADWGRDVERQVSERTRAGLPPLSVVAATKLPLTAAYQQGIDDGVLVSRGPLSRITADGAVFADGSTAEADVILWATGFRASLDHLAPLHLREPGGGIRMDGPRVQKLPQLFLVGYGESSSTLGATRAGRAAATAALELLGTG